MAVPADALLALLLNQVPLCIPAREVPVVQPLLQSFFLAADVAWLFQTKALLVTLHPQLPLVQHLANTWC